MSENFRFDLFEKLPQPSDSDANSTASSSLERLGRTLTELAWAGGIVDGEGCIQINGASVAVDVQSTSRALIEKLHSILGGKCSVESRKTVYNRTVFRWRIYGKPAVEILQRVMPYLTEKKEQADLACSYYKYPSKSAMRKSIKKRIKNLKRTP